MISVILQILCDRYTNVCYGKCVSFPVLNGIIVFTKSFFGIVVSRWFLFEVREFFFSMKSFEIYTVYASYPLVKSWILYILLKSYLFTIYSDLPFYDPWYCKFYAIVKRMFLKWSVFPCVFWMASLHSQKSFFGIVLSRWVKCEVREFFFSLKSLKIYTVYALFLLVNSW